MSQSKRITGGGARRLVAAAASALICLPLMFVGPASADVPPPPGATQDFLAARCPGQTFADPTIGGSDGSSAAVPNLLSVFGQRRVDYNAGLVVPLYDGYGVNDDNGFPAVCGVRYSAVTGGPVSEWLFCTDYFSHVCSGTDAQGNTLVELGKPVSAYARKPAGNPRLSNNPDKEALIAYLVRHGHSYAGTGYFSYNSVATAVAGDSSTSDTRSALQALVWCISDPVAASPTGVEAERAQTCADNMGPAEQTRLLALIPAAPQLTLTGPSGTTTVGQSGTLTLRTNIFTEPLMLTVGAGATVTVASGPATLVGGRLTVTGTNAATPAVVTLSVTSNAVRTVSVSAAGRAVSSDDIHWNQSDGIGSDNDPCQVYANFDTTLTTPAATASARFVAAAPTTSTTSSTTSRTTASTTAATSATSTRSVSARPSDQPQGGGEDLAMTGSDLPAQVLLGTVLLLIGCGALLFARTACRPRQH